MRRPRFGRDQRGMAAVEFALITPILVLLALGCFEVPSYVLVFQKMSRASAGVADLVAQADDPITKDQLVDIFSGAKSMMQPYDVVNDGEVIVTSINNPSGTGVKITWQRKNGLVATASKLGSSGTPANLPAGLTPAADEEVLVAEVYYNYKPMFGNIIYKGSQLYRVSYTRPRNHNLETVPPTDLTPSDQ